MDQLEGEYLALLVHKGFLAADEARAALAEQEQGETIPELLGRLGLLAVDEARRLFDNRVGTQPQLHRYELREELGSGATAVVYEVFDRQDERVVALKVLREEVARVPEKLARFVNESKLLCELSHPGIVAGYRIAKDGGTYFLAMELIPGRTLEERIEERGRVPEDEALGVVFQVAQALAYLREQGLVHRDIKPGNLMQRDDGRVQLIDLGFAARQGEIRASDSTLGTVQYIAPEQARGDAGLDSRADIYALGATLYHMCTGEVPFYGESNQEQMLAQISQELSSTRIKALDLSAELHYCIEKMMAKEREIRYQRPEDLVADFEDKFADRAFLSLPDPEPIPEPLPRARRSLRHRPGARTRGSQASRRRRGKSRR